MSDYRRQVTEVGCALLFALLLWGLIIVATAPWHHYLRGHGHG